MKPEPKARTMQMTANDQLRLRILTANARHHPASRGAIDDVNHCLGSEQ